MTLRDLILRVRALAAPRRVERELDEELAFHVECEVQKYIDGGLSPEDARTRARARFGSVPLAADQCRDARGTAFFDTLTQDVRYAFTMFRRAPLAALTIVLTVALGLGLVAVVFTCYNALFLRVDAVRNPAELFEVRRPPAPRVTAVWHALTRQDYDALRRDTSVFTDVLAMFPLVEARIAGHPTTGTLVTGNFFQVLGVNAALGRTLTAADDERFAGQPVIVLSHRAWATLFAADPAVLGQRVALNGASYEVIGIMPPQFRGLATSAPDYWAPLGRLGQLRQALAGKDDRVELDVVGRLKPGVSPKVATAALTAWAAGNPQMEAEGDHPKTILLLPRLGTNSAGAVRGLLLFTPMFFAFGLILLIGCANVANLLLARGVSRQREIGIRLSLGASRRRIVGQLLTESLLLGLAAAAGGFAASRLILEAGASVAVATLPPQMAEQIGVAALAADWRVVAFLLGGAVASTVLFGLAPALRATRLELVRTMRGEVTRDARPGRARHALIAVQVTASAMLVVGAAVFLRSAFAAARVEPGLRVTDTVLLELTTEPLRPAMLQAVRADASVAAVAASWPARIGGQWTEASVSAADKPAETSARSPVEFKFVSPEYFDLLDIAVLKGRTFTPAERSPSTGVAVVSDTVARKLWPGREAVGQVMRLDSPQPPQTLYSGSPSTGPHLPLRAFTVVGVVRDARVGAGMFEVVDAGVYLPIGAESAGASLVLRVHGDPDLARQALIDRLSRVDPSMGRVTTLRTIAGRATLILQIVFWVAAVLGGLALALTLSGLFSVLSYLVEQRSKEIGVRMALGATPRDITGLVLSQLVRPVAFGLVAGGGLAGLLATLIVATSPVAGIVKVLDPLAYAASLMVIVTACALAASVPAMRAARIDPIATLRND